MKVSPRIIRALPKADLHSHIDGSVSARELLRIARRHHRRILTPKGRELDSPSEFMNHVVGSGYDSLLEDIVDRFYPITALMQTSETIRDVGVSYVEGQKKDGVTYAEGRFAPQYHTLEGLSLKDVVTSMSEGLREGGEKYGVEASLTVAVGRESSPGLGEEIARVARSCDSVVALDLGGPERGNPPQKFRRAFELAKSYGLKVTIHAGEGAGSRRQNLANVRTAISMGADRVGHAIDLASDPSLMSLVREKSVGIEMNPVSNLVLRKIKSVDALAIDRLLDAGVLVSVNSDDPALWPNGSLSSVYSSVCESYGFGMKELDSLMENSFRTAFAGDRGRLIERYRSERSRLTD